MSTIGWCLSIYGIVAGVSVPIMSKTLRDHDAARVGLAKHSAMMDTWARRKPRAIPPPTRRWILVLFALLFALLWPYLLLSRVLHWMWR